MPEGHQTVGAHPRANDIDLLRQCDSLATAVRRLGVVTRMHQSECDYLEEYPPANQDGAVAAWRVANELLDEAVLKVDQIALRILEAAVEVTGILRHAETKD